MELDGAAAASMRVTSSSVRSPSPQVYNALPGASKPAATAGTNGHSRIRTLRVEWRRPAMKVQPHMTGQKLRSWMSVPLQATFPNLQSSCSFMAAIHALGRIRWASRVDEPWIRRERCVNSEDGGSDHPRRRAMTLSRRTFVKVLGYGALAPVLLAQLSARGAVHTQPCRADDRALCNPLGMPDHPVCRPGGRAGRLGADDGRCLVRPGPRLCLLRKVAHRRL